MLSCIRIGVLGSWKGGHRRWHYDRQTQNTATRVNETEISALVVRHVLLRMRIRPFWVQHLGLALFRDTHHLPLILHHPSSVIAGTASNASLALTDFRSQAGCLLFHGATCRNALIFQTRRIAKTAGARRG